MTATLDIVQLADGRFGVREGDASLGEFDTRAQAEQWMFDRVERSESVIKEPGALKPGSGQGLR